MVYRFSSPNYFRVYVEAKTLREAMGKANRRVVFNSRLYWYVGFDDLRGLYNWVFEGWTDASRWSCETVFTDEHF